MKEELSNQVLLINPPNPPQKVSNKDMMGGFGQCYSSECEVKVPPIDIPYIAAVLRNSKINVKVIECLGSCISINQLLEELSNYSGALVFIRTSTPTFLCDIETARKIKEKTKVCIVFFGPHVSTQPDNIIDNPYIDALVLGEPEYVIRDIVVSGLKDTPGGWYKKDGQIIKNKSNDFIDNLDLLPFPAWDLLPYETYTVGQHLMPKQRPTLFIQTSRGCTFGCSYCPYPIAQGIKYRKRSPENVLNEFAYLVHKFDVKNVVIRDPEFTLDRDRVIKICNGLISANYSLVWRCETRIDTLDESLVSLMRKAGCIGINIGIESKNEKICKNVGRAPLNERHTKNIVRKCKEIGIHTFCFFIIGLPGDNIRSALETIMFAIELRSDISQFTVVTPYMNTKLYKWATDNHCIEKFSLSGVSGYEAMMKNEELSSAEIQLLRDGAQSILSTIEKARIRNEKEELTDSNDPISFIMTLYFSKYYSQGIRQVVIYGIKGVSISKLKKKGFQILAIVDERHEGKKICDNIVLSLPFIKLFKPEAVLVSPFKNSSNLKHQVPEMTAIIECIGGVKTALIWIIRKLLRLKKK